MSENTIFSNKPPTVPPPPPPQRPTGSPPPGVPPQPSIKPRPPEFHDASHSNPLKMLLLGGAGLLLVVVIVIIIAGLVFSSKSSSGDVTLTYWGLWEDPKVMNSVIADFERQNPHIKVTYVQQDIKDYRARIETRINNGDGPDIYRFHNTWLPMLSGYLLPLSNTVISPDQFSQQFYPVAQKDLIANGAIYGIPMEIDTLEMFTNDAMLQSANLQVPTNWIDFAKVAKTLTTTDPITGNIKTSGAGIGGYDNITHAPDLISLLLLQNGTDLKNLSSSQHQIATALQFYTQFAKGSDAVWDTNREKSIQAFASGDVGMYFGYSWDIFTIKSLNPSLSFHISPVPTLPKAAPLTIASYWVEGVSSKTKHPAEAMLFMHYLAQKETEQKLYTESSKARQFGEPFAARSLAETVKNNPLVYPFLSQATTAVSSYFASDTYDGGGINELSNSYLGNAVRSMLDGTSSDTATDTMTTGVEQVLKQYGQ